MAALAHPRAGAVSLLRTMLAAVDYFKRAVPVRLGTIPRKRPQLSPAGAVSFLLGGLLACEIGQMLHSQGK